MKEGQGISLYWKMQFYISIWRYECEVKGWDNRWNAKLWSKLVIGDLHFPSEHFAKGLKESEEAMFYWPGAWIRVIVLPAPVLLSLPR